MSFWAFDQKLYVFGGFGKGDKLVEDGVQQIQLDLAEKTARTKPVEILGLEPRRRHSTTIVQEDTYSQTILILGGRPEKYRLDNAMIAFKLIKTKEF